MRSGDATRREFRQVRFVRRMVCLHPSFRLVDEIYAAGAKSVLAVEIDREDDMENTGKLLIELPNAPADRETVLAITGKIAEEQGFDPESDIGQKHVFIMLD